MDENEKTMSLRDAIAQGWDSAVEEAPADTPAEVQEQPAEEPVQETPVQDVPAEEAPVVNEPVQEVPAQQPSHGNDPVQMQQLMELIRQQQDIIGQLTQQNAQQGQAMQQQSALAEEAVNETMAEPYPQFDFEAVRYLDAAAQNQAMMQWQQAVMERATRDAVAQAMGQMAPIREQYEANRRMAEDDAARTAVFADSRFADFSDRRGEIEKVIAATPALQGMRPTDKWVVAGLMDRGMRHQAAPTAAEIIEMAQANPEVMKALAAKQASEIAQAQASVPKIAPSTGMAQAQAIPENRPKNIKELGAAIKKGLW